MRQGNRADGFKPGRNQRTLLSLEPGWDKGAGRNPNICFVLSATVGNMALHPSPRVDGQPRLMFSEFQSPWSTLAFTFSLHAHEDAALISQMGAASANSRELLGIVIATQEQGAGSRLCKDKGISKRGLHK